MTTIGRRSFVFLAIKLVAALLGYVGLYFMTKYLPADYGTIMTALSTVAAFNALADLGFSSAHIKKVSEGKDLNDCVSTFATVKLVLTGITVAITIVGLLIWATYMGGDLTGTAGSLIVLFLFYNIFLNLSTIPTTTFNAHMEVFKSTTAALVEVAVRIPLIAIFALGGAGAIPIGYAYVVGALAVLLYGMYILVRRDRIKFVRPTFIREYWAFSLPLAIIAVVGTLAGTMDKLIIAGFYPDVYVGYYTASQAFLSIFAFIGAAVATMTYPSFSKLHVNGNMEDIRKITRQAERYISIIGMPITALIVAFPTETAMVMLNNMVQAAGPMRFLALATMLTMLNQVHTSQILAVNRPDLSAKVTLVNFVFFGILLFIFVPSTLFGVPWLGLAATGAAIAMMISTAIMFVIVRYVVYRLTKTGTNPRIGLHILAAIFAAFVLQLLASVFALTGWIPMIVYGLVSLGAFLLALWELNELHWDDVMYFWDILNPKKLWHYIRGEMKKKEAN